MKRRVRLSKWRHSKAIKIHNQIIKHLNLSGGQKVTVTIEGDFLTSAKSEPTNIHELFKGWQDDDKRDHELDWGTPKGSELPW